MNHKKWMEGINKLNKDQPSLIDLVNDQIQSFEENKYAPHCITCGDNVRVKGDPDGTFYCEGCGQKLQ